MCPACLRGVYRPLALMKSACWVPLTLTSFDALTMPRVYPTTVLVDHHHILLPLHLLRGR